MAKKTTTQPTLLRWSQHVQESDVQDPLGLGLRGSTRLASRLLHCITSITPRARYFSFIPWCILDFQKREKSLAHRLSLRDAIVLREKALTLACVAHHRGDTCKGGALVGTREASKWFAKGYDQADLKRLSFAKVPALSAYYTSLVNLGCFITEEELEDTDDEATQPSLTFDEIQLSSLGQQLGSAYSSVIGRLSAVQQLIERPQKCSVKSLAEWGKRGGLCELVDNPAPDRDVLRQMFFARIGRRDKSHPIRKQSLLLVLELCRQLSDTDCEFSERVFASAVYFGEINDDERLKVAWPLALTEIATRWRMFYFHHFMSVALEGMFSWLLSQLAIKGISGATIDSLVVGLDSNAVRKTLADQWNVNITKPFGTTSPAIFFALFGAAGELSVDESRKLDSSVTQVSAVAESRLEQLIRDNSFLQSPAGLAVPMVLLALTLGRYKHWHKTVFGDWLAKAATDPYLDLIPPVLTEVLSNRFGNWWSCSWKELATFVLSRFVVRQHIAMSYEKTAAGDRCLLQLDGDKVISTESYDEIGLGNPRLRSAVQILKDLGLLADTEDQGTDITAEGCRVLDAELLEAAK